MKKILLSVVVPCYNESKFIDKTISSISISLKYNHISNYEIILVDDNYSDAVKLEIYTKEGLFNKKRNNRLEINNFIVKDEHLNEINPHSKYYVTSKNIKDAMINISSKQKINAFSLQTNIP